MTLGFGGAVDGHLHTGVDYFCGYLSPVYSPYDGVVTFRDDATGALALVVGTTSPKLFLVEHMATTTVSLGSSVKAGDLMGLEGYKGETYYRGVRENSQAASHRHYGVYLLAEDAEIIPGEFYILSNGDWYTNGQGNYLRIREPDNGYDGACDPLDCL
ncbi:hypothetical protein A3A39_03750 [Candidatus Kaiserbacteria bacterium RIFCSPLOWO2_01_FULL_54_13]|uniref:M23ase beta-sheet core domain-containing protein n=1 Tax=Candidatus Kaiserbacteria bacterium RIFCSPLOWO2_01_FULL_54_13 TaxID=1798512 RepID=A0A1F6F218_9BACT|nr:MAG: hypothetical protein A3A39_03750 [Candidatus Kaiserbacteria bacterium RIFCSPLOWO2_01_FULL_54_13]